MSTMKTYTYEEVLDMCRIAVALDRESRKLDADTIQPEKLIADLSGLRAFQLAAHPPVARKRRMTKPK
jgi:hypothetical protein